jgi:hypothetical protein
MVGVSRTGGKGENVYKVLVRNPPMLLRIQ